MRSIIDEILKLRSTNEGTLVAALSGHQRILYKDQQHFTAYYFGTDIFTANGQLIDLSAPREKEDHEFSHHVCKNKKIVTQENKFIFLQENESFTISVDPPYKRTAFTDASHCVNSYEIIPTLNGLAFHVYLNDLPFSMQVQTSAPYTRLRCNDRYVAWMKQDFLPHMYMSVLYGIDHEGNIVPAQYRLQEGNDHFFKLQWNNQNNLSEVWFELNFHEEKLFQDTTVQSRFPSQNNVYGCTAFVGNTNLYGTQWLLSKPSFPLLADLHGKELLQVLWHIPCLKANSSAVLQLQPTKKRFCSFGTTWASHIPEKTQTPILFQPKVEGYLTADITSLYSNQATRSLEYFDGCILRLTNICKQDYVVITTGDSCLYPPILEVKYT